MKAVVALAVALVLAGSGCSQNNKTDIVGHDVTEACTQLMLAFGFTDPGSGAPVGAVSDQVLAAAEAAKHEAQAAAALDGRYETIAHNVASFNASLHRLKVISVGPPTRAAVAAAEREDEKTTTSWTSASDACSKVIPARRT